MKLEDYLKLPYPARITPLSEEDGGGYHAQFLGFGRYLAQGDGETVEEAMADAREGLRAVIEDRLGRGESVPLPREGSEYSGRFVVRTPARLHQELAEQAELEGTSLNQLVVSLLSKQVQR